MRSALLRPLGAPPRRPPRQLLAAAGPQDRRFATGGKTYDAIVIGSGVIGAASALELRRKGFTTLNVDANPSPGYGSTSSSSAIIRHYYSLEDSCRVAWEAYHYWKVWRDFLEAPPSEEVCHLNEIGSAILDVPANPSGQAFLGNVRASMEACGVQTEYWSRAELQKRCPYMCLDSFYPPKKRDHETFGEPNGGSVEGALFCPQSGYVNDPQLAARNLADAALRMGGDFRWKAAVKRIELDPTGTRVRGVSFADGETVEAPIVVNAAGPHSPVIHDLAFAGAKVPDDSVITSKPLRVEVAYVQEPPGANLDKTLPVMLDADAGVYYRPQQGGTMVVGSVEPECDDLEFLAHADELERRDGLSDEWTNYMYRAALRFPGLQIPNTATGLVSMYDVTEDWVPIYDRTSIRGFYAMRGTSGNQFKNAPVAGQVCAELVEGVENGLDHDAAPIRLPLRHTSASVSLALFSRLRSKRVTTGSVLG